MDIRDDDVAMGDGDDDILLDDTTASDWLGELASRCSTLQGRLWLVVFFLIFAMMLGNGGCRFNMSGPD
jgi:hypothetical protein